MRDGVVSAGCKQLSALRRFGEIAPARWLAVPGLEGYAGVFCLSSQAAPIVVEAASGRAMAIAPGDVFLATPGYRESTRWVVGNVPDGGLRPGAEYWVLAECGIVGELVGQSSLPKGHLGQAKYFGAVIGSDGNPLHLKDFAIQATSGSSDHGAPVFLLLGTSAEVGKTTAGLTLLKTLLTRGSGKVAVLKATGTSSVTELAAYLDFGATFAYDCLDFGLPTTFPSSREGITAIFDHALDVCLSHPADAVLIECGGDILGGSVPDFIRCLQRRRSELTTVLVAGDPFGALGAKQVLHNQGLTINLITGPCCDTSTSRQRTETVCQIAARSMRSTPMS